MNGSLTCVKPLKHIPTSCKPWQDALANYKWWMAQYIAEQRLCGNPRTGTLTLYELGMCPNGYQASTTALHVMSRNSINFAIDHPCKLIYKTISKWWMIYPMANGNNKTNFLKQTQVYVTFTFLVLRLHSTCSSKVSTLRHALPCKHICHSHRKSEPRHFWARSSQWKLNGAPLKLTGFSMVCQWFANGWWLKHGCFQYVQTSSFTLEWTPEICLSNRWHNAFPSAFHPHCRGPVIGGHMTLTSSSCGPTKGLSMAGFVSLSRPDSLINEAFISSVLFEKGQKQRLQKGQGLTRFCPKVFIWEPSRTHPTHCYFSHIHTTKSKDKPSFLCHFSVWKNIIENLKLQRDWSFSAEHFNSESLRWPVWIVRAAELPKNVSFKEVQESKQLKKRVSDWWFRTN